jgi:hypothetical protein
MDITAERKRLLQAIESLQPCEDSTQLCLQVFRYQAVHNPVYARFLELLGRRADKIQTIDEIPFLPVGCFKTHSLQCGAWAPETVYTSSTTTGQTPSQHLVREVDWYLANARRGFSQFYGDPSDWCILALLPAYLERQGSSLVAMADDFIRRSCYPDSGFFLHNHEALAAALEQCVAAGRPTLLLGVSFALLDFAEHYARPLPGVTVMETGGMKGRRTEMTREALHEVLKSAFGVPRIHSEYGMTELLSQGYLAADGWFRAAATMQVLVREVYDPFTSVALEKTGVLNVVDLANLDTCSFVATEDVGRLRADGAFQVLGRLDMAEMRGCNLLVV